VCFLLAKREGGSLLGSFRANELSFLLKRSKRPQLQLKVSRALVSDPVSPHLLTRIMVSKHDFGGRGSSMKIHHVEVGEHISPSASRFGESIKILFRLVVF
jgi:hypothetical protein